MALALNSDNDIFAENSSIRRVVGSADAVQHARSRLLTYLGEWFLDTTAGVPYFTDILVKPADLNIIESILKEKISSTTGILSLIEFGLDFNSTTRTLEVTFKAETEDSESETATVNFTI